MKNLILLFSFVLLTLNLNSQSCNDLIVSEVVFGNLSGKGTQYNHSVEVFNPTSSAIDLVNYKIELVPETGQSTIIDLSGIVPPEDVYVISNVTANGAIISVSDVLETLLSFDGFVAIQLTKNSGEIVDKFGRQGVSQSSTTIDFNALLNDPNYLNGLDINLGSIENLLIRRKSNVKEGNSNFLNEDLLDEWLIYPNFEIGHLGQHLSACTAAMLGWTNVQQLSWEKELIESNGAIGFPFIDPSTALEFGSGEICLTEPLNYDLNVYIFSALHEYTIANDPDATQDADWGSDIVDELEFEIPAGQLCIDWPELSYAIIDTDNEMEEGFGISVSANDQNGLSIVDPDREITDFRIIDPIMSTKDRQELNASISIYPTIATGEIFLEYSNEELKIEEVRLYSINGAFIKSLKIENGFNNRVELNLNGINSKGYHVLFLKTNKGIAAKKFYKK